MSDPIDLMTVTDTEILDETLLPLATELENTILLAAERAVLHYSDPWSYPIDGRPGSLELAFRSRFATRKPGQRRQAIATTKASLRTPERAARLGALAAIDLKSPIPILDQAAKLLGWAAKAHPVAGPGGNGHSAPAPDDLNAVIRCRVRKVTCAARPDAQIVAGILTNDKGKSTGIEPLILGDGGGEESYSPPMWFAASRLASGVQGSLEGSSWPKEYLATLVVCERRDGAFIEWMAELLEAVKGVVAAWIGGAAGETIGTAAFAGLGSLGGADFGALVGYLLGSLVDALQRWWDEDRIHPITALCRVHGYVKGRVTTSSAQRFDVIGERGETRVELDWQVHWPSHFGDKVDAAVNWGNGKVYFFSGPRFVRYDIAEGRADPGYPADIADHWPGLWPEGVHAGVVWNERKAFFFRGDEYIRYDIAEDRADPGYPKKIEDGWEGIWPAGIDAVLRDPVQAKAYFFRGDQYIRYDIDADRADPGYPLPIGPGWSGAFARDIDAVAVLRTKAYFFRDDGYVRYDLVEGKAETGVLQTDYYWPGL